MRVLVHAGMQKTGSSALQEYLARNREALQERGFIYPDFGHRGHWPVTAAFMKKPETFQKLARRSSGEEVEDRVLAVHAALRKTLKTRPDDILILSHEDLSVARIAKSLCRFLARSDGDSLDLHFIAYVRDPVRHYASALQQALKTGKIRSFLPSTWRSPHFQRAERMSALLGDRLSLRLYAPTEAKSWDVIEDFRAFCLARYDRELPEAVAVPSVNSSLSAKACAMLEIGKALGDEGIAGMAFRRMVRKFDAGQPMTRLVVPEMWKRDIATTSAAEWNALLDRVDGGAKFKIDPTGEKASGHTYSESELRSWIVSHLDLAYAAALADFCRTGGADETADWIDRTIARIGGQEPAAVPDKGDIARATV